jgi:glycogen debranching enzyme
VRNVTYSTSAEILENEITPSEGGYTVDLTVRAAEDDSITLSIHPTLSASLESPPFSTALAAAESRWTDWFSRVPPVAPRYRKAYTYAWWIMANNLISPQGNVLYEAMTPSKMNYVGLWLWDSALHALAYRHVDPDLARNQIRSMLAHQLPNGMLPDAVFDEGIVATIDHPISGEVTKPPILAWAVMKLHETSPDLAFLREVYTPLVRLNGWWFSMNDDDGDGLVQYNHPYSSGLDDSPLWDFGMPVESPDINTYLCTQMQALEKIAGLIGYTNESLMWHKRVNSLVRRMIADMWDEHTGVFWTLLDEKPVQVLTPFNLYPLWTGMLPEEINIRLVAHLTNPDTFGGPYVIPTVSRTDPRYNPERMWRGPVWANVNYFMAEALEKTGRDYMARELRKRTLDMIMAYPDMYEYYNADTGAPPMTAAKIFGWTAAVFIDMAIQVSREEGDG